MTFRIGKLIFDIYHYNVPYNKSPYKFPTIERHDEVKIVYLKWLKWALLINYNYYRHN